MASNAANEVFRALGACIEASPRAKQEALFDALENCEATYQLSLKNVRRQPFARAMLDHIYDALVDVALDRSDDEDGKARES